MSSLLQTQSISVRLSVPHHSATRPNVYMFCETWESDELLTKHSNAEHFTRLVPQIEALTKDGLHLERFEK